MLRGVRPPRPSGTPPEGGELGRGRDFSRGRRECVGEELGLSGNRFGPEQSAPMEKPGDTDKNNSHIVSGSPEPPPPGGGRGWSRTGLPNEEKMTGKTTALPCTYPGKSSEIPSRKFTIPPRLVNSIFIFHCKPARKKIPKKLDKGGLGLYLCRWGKRLFSRHNHDEETAQQF